MVAHHDEGLFFQGTGGCVQGGGAWIEEVCLSPVAGLPMFQILLSRHLAGTAGREDDCLAFARFCNVKGSVESVGPGLGRDRPDNAGCAENGETSHDAKAGIEGLFGSFFAVGDGTCDVERSRWR